jgi:chromosome segregation ATPase
MSKAEVAQSDARLSEINDELSKILAEKMEFLTKTLNETQRTTHKIAQIELEVQRHTSQYAGYEDEVKSLEKELGTLNTRLKASTEERDKRQQDKYDKEKELQRLDWEISDKIKSNDEASTRIRSLESDLEKNDAENKKLASRVAVLEEGVDRMRKVREEYMAKIAGLDQEMKGLAGTKE